MGIGLMVLLVAGVVLLAFFVMYNSMVGKKNQVEQAFATIDAMLKKRYDLIPNLVNTVKTYMKHESSILEDITRWRAQAMSGGIGPDETVGLNNRIGKALSGIMVAMESYPELKANENFLDLQRSLNEIEEQLSAARRAFNAAVTDYNNAVEMIPTSIIAGMMGYRRRRLFEASEVERKNVDVGALFDG
jgi:LemA protein